MPRGEKPLGLPSDLLGLPALTYDARRSDGRLLAALGPAVHTIRTTLRALGAKRPAAGELEPLASDSTDLTPAFVAQWEEGELSAAREVLRRGIPLHACEDETGEPTKALRRVFAFLDSMADALLAGRVVEAVAREVFDSAVRSVWERARIYLAPLNAADEVWDPPPPLAILYRRWNEG